MVAVDAAVDEAADEACHAELEVLNLLSDVDTVWVCPWLRLGCGWLCVIVFCAPFVV